MNRVGFIARGFRLFNNVAVGALHVRRVGYRRILIIDIDAHHGNGTQHIFEEDDTVFYFSTHQYPSYPETGKDMERGRGKGKGCDIHAADRTRTSGLPTKGCTASSGAS